MDISKETVESLARKLGMNANALLALARKAPKLYRSWPEPKKSGKGYRIIEAPYANLKAVQRILLDKVLSKLPVNSMLFGGKGSSPKKAVERHTRKPLVIAMDITDFFPSVKRHMIRQALRKRGASAEVAKILARLMTHKNHVPHGAPTSPCITRIVLHPVAEHIDRLLRSIGHESDASIYVDDLTLSGPNGLNRLQKTIDGIFERYGFSIHPNKIQIMSRDKEQVSLGIKLNHGIDIPSHYIVKYREKLRQVGPSDPRVKGMRSYIHSLNPKVA